MTLLKSVLHSLLDRLSTEKLPYYYASELFIYVVVIEQVFTCGADCMYFTLFNSIDRFIWIHPHVDQAVAVDGFSVSSSKQQSLRYMVVAIDAECKIFTETFEEPWSLIYRGDTYFEDKAFRNFEIVVSKERVFVKYCIQNLCKLVLFTCE